MVAANNAAMTGQQADEFSALRDGFAEWQGGLDRVHPLNRPRFEAVESEADPFLSIMEKAVQEGGYSDPIAFVQGLSDEELETLRVMHSFAAPISAGGLSEEGALNLLLPMNQRKDIDNDGFLDLGHSVSWTFPPPNAPQSVHEAWAETTEGMSDRDRLMAEGMFLPSMIRLNDSGGVSEVERSKANNPYAKAGFSFTEFVEQRLDALEYFKHLIDDKQYESQKSTLSTFLEELQSV